MGYSSIQEIVKLVEKKAQEGLETRVAKEVKEVVVENASRGVYEAYKSKYHDNQNRLTNEGNLDSDVSKKHISIYYKENLGYYDMGERYPNMDMSHYVPTSTILYRFAYGGVWGPEETFLPPSPFFFEAKQQVQGNKVHVKAMKSYLSQFFNVK